MKNYKEFLIEKVNNLKPTVELNFPHLRQVFNYDCGVCALQQVLVYYGIEKREDELIHLLDAKRTNIIEHGSKLSKMKEVAEYYGLEAEIVRNAKIKDIIKLIDEKTPPIILMQAWRDFSVNNLDWTKDFKDGHYVVAVGYNDNVIFFEDPASVIRTYLTYKEFEKRWHDVDDDNKTHNFGVMVVVKGDNKNFDNSSIIHMD